MKMMMEEDKEIWAPIEGYEGYEISTKGRVRSYWKRISIRRQGGNRAGFDNSIVLTDIPQKYLKLSDGGGGYYTIRIGGKNELLHRIMAKTFLPNPENLTEVDHIDRNRQNYALSNLRWASTSQNRINTPIRKDNKHGSKGIRYRHNKQKWQAYWSIDQKCIFSQYFDTKEEAIEHRKKMVEEHYDTEFYTET
jgi:hypothetical protein